MEHGCSKNTPARRQPHGRSGPADRRHLQGFGFRQRRQQPRKTLGQQRFADTGRAGHHQVMGTGRGDLNCEPGPPYRRGPQWVRRRRRSVDPVNHWCNCPNVRTPHTSTPSTRLASARLSTGTTTAGLRAWRPARQAAPPLPDEPARRAPIRPAALSFRVAPTPSYRWLTRPRRRAPAQKGG